MIYYLFHDYHAYTVHSFLAGFDRAAVSRFEPVEYGRFFRRSRLPVGSYIFSDLERLAPADLERAARLWRSLETSGRAVRLLNHPLRVKRRYELLRCLYEAGINRFNVYRLTECRRPERFPVFIRGENDHAGPETPLLNSQAELDEAVEALAAAGKTRDGRIVTEYGAAPDGKGYFRKYAALVVGRAVFPRSIIFSNHWVAKMPTAGYTEDMEREEAAFVAAPGHVERLREVAALANVDYGRIDYTLVEGRVQVFEINTNPDHPRIRPQDPPARTRRKRELARKTMDALLDLDSPEPRGRRVPVQIEAEAFWWRHRHLPYRAAQLLTRLPVLRRFGPRLYLYLSTNARKVHLKRHP